MGKKKNKDNGEGGGGGLFSFLRRKKSSHSSQALNDPADRLAALDEPSSFRRAGQQGDDHWYPHGCGSLRVKKQVAVIQNQGMMGPRCKSMDSLKDSEAGTENGSSKVGISLKHHFKELASSRRMKMSDMNLAEQPEGMPSNSGMVKSKSVLSMESGKTKQSGVSSDSLNNLIENMKICASITELSRNTPTTSMGSGDDLLNKPHILR